MFYNLLDNKIRAIEKKASDTVDIEWKYIEPLQVVSYLQGQEFKVHHDSGTFNEDDNSVDGVLPRRYVTFFVYLNTLPEGQGHTEFPALNLSVRPQKGNALMFCNVLPNGQPDPRLIHRACPVTENLMKIGMNIWLGDQNWEHFPSKKSVSKNKRKKIYDLAGNETLLSIADDLNRVYSAKQSQPLVDVASSTASDHVETEVSTVKNFTRNSYEPLVIKDSPDDELLEHDLFNFIKKETDIIIPNIKFKNGVLDSDPSQDIIVKVPNIGSNKSANGGIIQMPNIIVPKHPLISANNHYTHNQSKKANNWRCPDCDTFILNTDEEIKFHLTSIRHINNSKKNKNASVAAAAAAAASSGNVSSGVNSINKNSSNNKSQVASNTAVPIPVTNEVVKTNTLSKSNLAIHNAETSFLSTCPSNIFNNIFSNNNAMNSGATFKFDARMVTGFADTALILDESDEIDSSLLDEFDICGPDTTIFNDDVHDSKRLKLEDTL